ncbi:MAG: adenosine deaminase family protein [Kiritimatiellia bacterium]|jgi:adenosine deaminase|nr:adenosine deaminase family protein [Kiritimatiellia bacterium]MDP6847520.1 adenosine deaminase family protein [Kiritimatiellia bacterium]
MKPIVTDEFIKAIPKTDLHLHLDGSLRLSTLIELARAQGVKLPSYEEAGLQESVFKSSYASLKEYLRGFMFTTAVLQDAESIERVACELAEDSIAEGVRYIEVRFAPQLHVRNGVDTKDVIRAVGSGLERAGRAHNNRPEVREGEDLPFVFGIIVCAMRTFNRNMGPYFSKLTSVLPGTTKKELVSIASHEMARLTVAARDQEGLPVVGFDLAGEEAGYPAAYHTRAYQYAHSHFMKKTVHAGEAYGPESIFQAITECHANRIGHGTFLFSTKMIKNRSIKNPEDYIQRLAEYIASQRITMEVCLTSNLQTIPSISTFPEHPLHRMLEHDLSISICTDNRLVSHTTVSQELGLVARHMPVTRRQFRNLVIAGFKGSFFPAPYSEKRTYVRNMTYLYDALARDLPPEDES